MITVNPYFLHTLLEPLTGLADDDEAIVTFAELDPNDELAVRKVIREMIVPHANSLSGPCCDKVRLAYRYYLSKPSANFGRVFESVLPPFNPPSDPRLFFLWVWEECFPGESFELNGIDNVTEVPDINEPLATE